MLAFLANVFGTVPLAQAQNFHLPAPGIMVHLSPPIDPPVLKGIKVHPDNPFRFDFILDQGNGYNLTNQDIKDKATRLIKYFLASLTIPEKDLWVNLSPYEKDRIIPQSFGLTEMGRDLLAEDYMLKQITASLIYPEDGIGKKFWKKVYEEAEKKYGTTNVSINTFNKVWIVPQKAVVYENAKAGTAYVVESKLKVMLEGDYLSLEKHEGSSAPIQFKDTNQLGNQIVREIVIPQLTKEVNENKNFAQLRQIYNSLILATWYKKKIKDSILHLVYLDKNKTAGIDIYSTLNKQTNKQTNPSLSLSGAPPQANSQIIDVQLIYQLYLKAFKKGVFNYIKEETLPIPGMPSKKQGIFPRKYFSGGMELSDRAMRVAMSMVHDFNPLNAHSIVVTSDLATVISMPRKDRLVHQSDMAMTVTRSWAQKLFKTASFFAGIVPIILASGYNYHQQPNRLGVTKEPNHYQPNILIPTKESKSRIVTFGTRAEEYFKISDGESAGIIADYIPENRGDIFRGYHFVAPGTATVILIKNPTTEEKDVKLRIGLDTLPLKSSSFDPTIPAIRAWGQYIDHKEPIVYVFNNGGMSKVNSGKSIKLNPKGVICILHQLNDLNKKRLLTGYVSMNETGLLISEQAFAGNNSKINIPNKLINLINSHPPHVACLSRDDRRVKESIWTSDYKPVMPEVVRY